MVIRAESRIFSTPLTKLIKAVPVRTVKASTSAVNETNPLNSLLIVSMSFSSNYRLYDYYLSRSYTTII